MIRNVTSFRFFLYIFSFFILRIGTAFGIDTCQSFSDYITEGTGSNCLMCSLYEIITDACATIAELSWEMFAEPLQILVAIATSLYIAFYTIKIVLSFSQQDTTAYLSNDKTGILPLLFKAAIVILVLREQEAIYKYLISPTIMTGLEVSTGIGGGSDFSVSTNVASNVRELFSIVIEKIREVNDQIYEIVALGKLMICIAMLPDTWAFFSWEWAMLPFGFILYVYGWLILIGFGFYVLDVLFRLCVGCMILPMAVACSFSKLTLEYTKRTWDLFVNVFFNFVMIGVVIRLSIEMIGKCVSYMGDGETSELVDVLKGLSEFSSDDAERLSDMLNLGGFTLMMICCLVCFQLFNQIEQLTDKVSGTSGPGGKENGIGSKLGKNTALVSKMIGKQPFKFGKAMGQVVGSRIRNSGTGRSVRGWGNRVSHGISDGFAKIEGTVFGTGRYSNRAFWR